MPQLRPSKCQKQIRYHTPGSLLVGRPTIVEEEEASSSIYHLSSLLLLLLDYYLLLLLTSVLSLRPSTTIHSLIGTL